MDSSEEKLIAALGNLDDYDLTGWKYVLRNFEDYGEGLWMWDKPTFKPKLEKHPRIDEVNHEDYNFCHCATPIVHHILIQHKETKKFYFVGNICKKRFMKEVIRKCIKCDQPNQCQSLLCIPCKNDAKIRRCVKCNNRNRCKSLHCKDCRIKCNIHKGFHDNNLQCCIKCNKSNDSDSMYCRPCSIEDILKEKPSFNSKYKTIRECFEDRSYITWLLNQEWFKRRKEYNLYQIYV